MDIVRILLYPRALWVLKVRIGIETGELPTTQVHELAGCAIWEGGNVQIQRLDIVEQDLCLVVPEGEVVCGRGGLFPYNGAVEGSDRVVVKAPARSQDAAEVVRAVQELEHVHPELGGDLLDRGEVVGHDDCGPRGLPRGC